MITQSNLLRDLAKYTVGHLGCTRTQFQSWLDALRSGKYRQTEKCLHDAEGFCCLGVRAEIELVQSGMFEWDETDKGIYSLKPSTGVNNEAFLPTDLIPKELQELLCECNFNNEAFLPTDLMPRSLQVLLSECNDGGLTFAEIADALEAHFMPLFEAEK